MSFATLSVILCVYLIIINFSTRSPLPVLRILYILLCFVMFCDRIYFNYYGKMPTGMALSMAGQLGAVTGTIKNLTKFSDLMYIADLPFLIILYILSKTELFKKIFNNYIYNNRNYNLKKITVRFMSFMLIVFVLSSAAISSSTAFKWSYFSNELMYYHLSDALGIFINKNIEKKPYKPVIAETEAETEIEENINIYSAAASGRNVIIIQVEALQNFVVGLNVDGNEITPVLNSLISGDSLYFNNYFYSVGAGNTSDAEFQVLNSIYTSEDEAVYNKYPSLEWWGLPRILKDSGYSGSYAFHGYIGSYWNREEAYIGQGFDDFMSEEDFPAHDVFNLGLSDKEFFKYSSDIMKSYTQPFMSLMVTLSSHHPYIIPVSERKLNLDKKYDNTLLGNYFQAMNYTDAAIGEFINSLKEIGLYDNSMLVIYGDHFGIPGYDAESYNLMSELLGHAYYEADIFNVPLIINIPSAEGINNTIDKVGSHIDVEPTLLYLLGIKNTKSVMFGHNLLDGKEGIVYEQMHMSRGSFITKDIVYSHPRSGITENTVIFDRKSHRQIKEELSKHKKNVTEAKAAFKLSEALLRYGDVFLDSDNQ